MVRSSHTKVNVPFGSENIHTDTHRHSYKPMWSLGLADTVSMQCPDLSWSATTAELEASKPVVIYLELTPLCSGQNSDAPICCLVLSLHYPVFSLAVQSCPYAVQSCPYIRCPVLSLYVISTVCPYAVHCCPYTVQSGSSAVKTWPYDVQSCPYAVQCCLYAVQSCLQTVQSCPYAVQCCPYDVLILSSIVLMLYLTLLNFTMAQPGSTLLYYILPSLYLALLDSTTLYHDGSAWLYFTPYTSLYNGSPWLYLTPLHSTMAVLDSTTL